MRFLEMSVASLVIAALTGCYNDAPRVEESVLGIDETPGTDHLVAGSVSCEAVWSAWIGPTQATGTNSCDVNDYPCLEDCASSNPIHHYEPSTDCDPVPSKIPNPPTIQLTRYGYPGHLGRTWVNIDFDTSVVPDDATITSAEIQLELFDAKRFPALAESPLPTQCPTVGGLGLTADPVISAKLAPVPSPGCVQPSAGETFLDYLNIECKLALWNITEFNQITNWSGNTFTHGVDAQGHLDRIDKTAYTRYAFDSMSLPPAQEFRVWEFYSHIASSNAPVMTVTYTQGDVVVGTMSGSSASGSTIDFSYSTDAPVLHTEMRYRIGGGAWTTLEQDYGSATNSHSFSISCSGGWVEWQAKTYGNFKPTPAKKFLANCLM